MTDVFRKYRDIKFNDEQTALLGQANAIIDQYAGAVTLRQLYYQLVTKNIIPNRQAEYNRLGKLISDGRIAGLVSWTAIEDRGRNLRGLLDCRDPGTAIRSMVSGYRIDKWDNQPYRPEVWVEKEALVGVIGEICNELEVDFFACKGYNSQSEQWRAGRRMADYISKGQTPIIFHLGDHDPSGIDMTRDNQERLSLFAGVQIQVVRLALNMNQIEQYQPPPNPVKMTDSRYGDYMNKYGEECWELDALTPDVVHDLIRDSVLRLRDNKKWDEALALEVEDKRRLEEVAEQFNQRDDDIGDE